MTPCPYCTHSNPVAATFCQSCGARLGAPLQALSAGATLQAGRYEITSTLGQGGFGITYLAQHSLLGSAVTIKELCPLGAMRSGRTLHPPTTQTSTWQQTVAGFVTEARTLARFQHPGIVRVQDVFEENNTAYFVMEYLEGGTLADAIGLAPFDPARTLFLAQQLAEALREVHAAGLLHRDIKPDNIILERGKSGRAVLIDFGSARQFASNQTMRHTTALTLGYAPLEQYSAQARFGPYTDIYALGGTLYTALTGLIPVDAVARTQGTALPFPPAIPAAWRVALERAMSIRIEDRPPSVDAFLALLPKPSTPPALAVQKTQVITPAVSAPPHIPRTQLIAPPAAPRRRAALWPWMLGVVLVASPFAWTWLGADKWIPGIAQNSSVNSSSSAAWSADQIEIAPNLLNVRAAPSSSAAILEVGGVALQAVRGERLAVTSTRSDWYEVTVQGVRGYVSGKHALPLGPRVSDTELARVTDAIERGLDVTLQAGVYPLPVGLRSAGGSIVGQGQFQSILVSSDRAPVLQFDGGQLTLRGLTLAHSGDAPAPVALFRNATLEISDVRFIGARDNTDPNGDEGDGLVLYDSSGQIDRAVFVGNVWRGASFHGATTVEVSNSEFVANGGSGVVMTDTATPRFNSSLFASNGLAGVKAFDNARAILSSANVAGNDKGGIWVTGGAAVFAEDSTCADNKGFAVKVDAPATWQVTGGSGCRENTVPTSPSGVSSAEAVALADEYLASGADNDVDAAMRRYAARVTYYTRGTLGRDEVRADKLSYVSRWPSRQYQRSSSVQTLQTSATGRRVRFEYNFQVDQPGKSVQGVAYVVLLLERANGVLVISEERGEVVR